MKTKQDLSVYAQSLAPNGKLEVITRDGEIKKLKEYLEQACHAAFHLMRLGVMDSGVYDHEFNTPIAMMENRLKELIGDE